MRFLVNSACLGFLILMIVAYIMYHVASQLLLKREREGGGVKSY